MAVDTSLKLPTFVSNHESDGEHEFTMTIGAIAKMEAHFKLESGLQTMANLAASHLGFLAWHARKRDGQKVGDFDAWLDGLIGVVPKEVPDDEGPTEADD